MKFFFAFILFFLLSINNYAQVLFLHIQPGVLGYGGDLSDNTINTNLLSPGGSFGLSLETGNHFAINASWTHGMIKGDDKYSATRFYRNLKFKSIINEYALTTQYNILDREQHKLSPFILGGIALFQFNPYAEQGPNKFYLHDYHTEGQGVYNNVNPYNLTQFSLPFGIGFEWAPDEVTRLGLVGIFRKTFTDYLDDVSGYYAPENILRNNFGPTSVSLAYQGDLLPGGSKDYPIAGSQRGNPQNKDVYYFLGITLKVNFRQTIGSVFMHREGNSSDGVRFDCPKL